MESLTGKEVVGEAQRHEQCETVATFFNSSFSQGDMSPGVKGLVPTLNLQRVSHSARAMTTATPMPRIIEVSCQRVVERELPCVCISGITPATEM
jgi:hypothetical protein